ncbi:MAG: DUF4258 domain-containing protein [Pseudomonadota bacterium]
MSNFARLGTWPDQPPKPNQLIAVIRSIAAETKDIVLLNHAEQRMYERNIDMHDILTVLKIGEIDGLIKSGQGDQEWKCKVTAPPNLDETYREIGIVVVTVRTSRLLIVTVEWEDKI